MTRNRSRAGVAARLLLPALGVALVPLVASPAHAQATRTWVSGVGDDVNPCSRTAPCKTFAGAIAKTAEGGTINVIDPGGFGQVTITKSITIDGTGVEASLLNSGASAITINAPASADVTLRDLDITGAPGATDGECGANQVGVRILGARSVRLDDLRISGQQTAIETPLSNSSTDLYVDIAMTDVKVTDSCQYGVHLDPDAGHRTRVSIADSHVTQSNVALSAGAGAETWASGTRLNLNNTGVELAGGVVHQGCGTEAVANATNGTFTDNTCGDPVAAPTPSTPTTPGQTPATPTVAGPAYCRVPRLVGSRLAEARAELKAVDCGLGKVTRRHTGKAKRQKVVGQSIPAGTYVRTGTKVRLVVGRR
jgi:hypothetical protein